MALWRPERPPLAIVRRATHGELTKQVLPLILELPPSYCDGPHGAYGADLGAVKGVAARCGFSVDGAQVCADGVTRRCVGAEPLKLRVMAIAFGRAPKYRSSKQRLTPQGDKPLRIEIAGVNRPQPHWCLTPAFSRRAPDEQVKATTAKRVRALAPFVRSQHSNLSRAPSPLPRQLRLQQTRLGRRAVKQRPPSMPDDVSQGTSAALRELRHRCAQPR